MLRNISAVIFAVITLVAFLAIYPTIITSVQAVLATAGLTDTFPAVASIITLVPLVAVIGGVSIAGLIAYVAAKKGGAGN